MFEIERKWLLNHMPEDIENRFTIIDHYNVEQFYISTDPNFRVCKIIKPDETICFINYKSKGKIKREEYVVYISESTYESFKLNDIGNKKPITKDFYRLIFNDKYELEVNNIDNGSFYYCEIEFFTEKEAIEFDSAEIEKFLGQDVRDVTFLDYFKMKNYWDITRNKNKTFTCDLIS